MDPFTAAAAVVAIVAPLLGRVAASAADVAARKAGEAVGEATVRGAATLWRRVVPRLHEQPDTNQALRRLAVDPSDRAAQNLVTDRLGALLEGDPKLLRRAVAVVDSRDQHVHAVVQLHGKDNVVATGPYAPAIVKSKNVNIHY